MKGRDKRRRAKKLREKLQSEPRTVPSLSKEGTCKSEPKDCAELSEDVVAPLQDYGNNDD